LRLHLALKQYTDLEQPAIKWSDEVTPLDRGKLL